MAISFSNPGMQAMFSRPQGLTLVRPTASNLNSSNGSGLSAVSQTGSSVGSTASAGALNGSNVVNSLMQRIEQSVERIVAQVVERVLTTVISRLESFLTGQTTTTGSPASATAPATLSATPSAGSGLAAGVPAQTSPAPAQLACGPFSLNLTQTNSQEQTTAPAVEPGSSPFSFLQDAFEMLGPIKDLISKGAGLFSGVKDLLGGLFSKGSSLVSSGASWLGSFL